jgi:hypothetical protein
LSICRQSDGSFSRISTFIMHEIVRNSESIKNIPKIKLWAIIWTMQKGSQLGGRQLQVAWSISEERIVNHGISKQHYASNIWHFYKWTHTHIWKLSVDKIRYCDSSVPLIPFLKSSIQDFSLHLIKDKEKYLHRHYLYSLYWCPDRDQSFSVHQLSMPYS